MRKFFAGLASLLFAVVVPGTVGGVVPWWISRWHFEPAFFDIRAIRLVGLYLILVGIIPLIESIARFAWKGLGTPAPVFPTSNLVVTGFYHHVRNPMYVGMLGVILGQALLFGDLRLLGYGAAFWLGTHLFITLYEEPTLRRRYGEEYADFCKHVPRWLPRWKPWNG
jgi:protein-S-isoprenylcysteine O-methyltransferase Ste14